MTAKTDSDMQLAAALDMLADSLDTFWNAALGATHAECDSTVNAVMSGMVSGVAAVATRLREHSAAARAAASIGESKS